MPFTDFVALANNKMSKYRAGMSCRPRRYRGGSRDYPTTLACLCTLKSNAFLIDRFDVIMGKRQRHSAGSLNRNGLIGTGRTSGAINIISRLT